MTSVGSAAFLTSADSVTGAKCASANSIPSLQTRPPSSMWRSLSPFHGANAGPAASTRERRAAPAAAGARKRLTERPPSDRGRCADGKPTGSLGTIPQMGVAAPPSPPGTSLIPYVPRHVLERILRGDVSDRSGPNRFEAVAMFADMSGYTGMSEAFSPLGAAGAEELS